MKAIFKTLFVIPFTSSLLFSCDPVPPGPRSEETVELSDIGRRCPETVLGGDREFDGNGPFITSKANLTISPDRKRLIATVVLHAKETKADWSETEGTWTETVYTAPTDKQIVSILSDNHSEISFTSPKAGPQFGFPGTPEFNNIIRNIINELVRIFSDSDEEELAHLAELVSGYIGSGSNAVTKLPGMGGELVKFFHIVGDTGGPDISNDSNPDDDTRFEKIEFNRARIVLQDR